MVHSLYTSVSHLLSSQSRLHYTQSSSSLSHALSHYSSSSEEGSDARSFFKDVCGQIVSILGDQDYNKLRLMTAELGHLMNSMKCVIETAILHHRCAAYGVDLELLRDMCCAINFDRTLFATDSFSSDSIWDITKERLSRPAGGNDYYYNVVWEATKPATDDEERRGKVEPIYRLMSHFGEFSLSHTSTTTPRNTSKRSISTLTPLARSPVICSENKGLRNDLVCFISRGPLVSIRRIGGAWNKVNPDAPGRLLRSSG